MVEVWFLYLLFLDTWNLETDWWFVVYPTTQESCNRLAKAMIQLLYLEVQSRTWQRRGRIVWRHCGLSQQQCWDTLSWTECLHSVYIYNYIYIHIQLYIYIYIYIYSSPVWGHCMDKECLNIFTHLPSVEEWSVNLWIFVRADVPKLSHSGLIRWMKLSIHLGLKDIYHTVQCLRRGMWGLRLLAGTIRNLQIILNIHYIIFHYINT